MEFEGGGGGALAGSLISVCCSLIFVAIFVAGQWKVFEKAGQPGWAAIVPFYNMYVLTQICGRPAWWIVLYFITGIGGLINAFDLALSFGKGLGWGVLNLFGIGYLLLGFGDAEYQGPKQAFFEL